MKLAVGFGRALMVLGATALACVIVVFGLMAYQVLPSRNAKLDEATPRDVRFVLNWCELGQDRIEGVVHSYESPRSLTGDHLDACAIKISTVDLKELVHNPNEPRQRWYRADNVPPVLDDAIGFLGGWLNEIPWFPDETAIRTANYYVYPWTIVVHGIDTSSAQLIIVNPSDRMVYYFSGKT